jgi:tetratricopeptide (TPR) repeat protein
MKHASCFQALTETRRIIAPLVLASFIAGSSPQERIAWKEDYEAALEQSRQQGKLLVVHFWLEGRPLGKEMNDETFSNSEVVRFANRSFLNVKVRISERPELFDKTIGGRGGLGTCVLDGSGDVVSALPGFAGPQVYLQFLRRAEEGYPKLRVARIAANRNPSSVSALHHLAETYQELVSVRRAEEHFEMIIRLGAQAGKLTPQLKKYVAFSHERIARARAMRGKNREAARETAEYRRLDPENRFGRLDRVILTEALISWIERRLKDALRILEGALKDFPSSSERDQMLLATGVVRHEAQDDAGALVILERLVKEYPLSPAVAQAKEQIAHIKNPPPEHQH